MENNWKLTRLMVAVKDLDEAVKRHESIGITGFSDEVILDRTTVYTNLEVSRPGDRTASIKFRTARLDSLDFELLQPLSGDSFQKEFLDNRGESVVNLSYNVEDLEAEKTKLIKAGIPVILTAETDRYSIGIFNTCKVSTFYTQLMQLKK